MKLWLLELSVVKSTFIQVIITFESNEIDGHGNERGFVNL